MLCYLCILYTSVIQNAPDVQEGMVPVRYVEEEQGEYWVIASSDSANWYNYYSNEWANVCLLYTSRCV